MPSSNEWLNSLHIFDVGKMRHIAFALDPDGYWIEVIPRGTPNQADGSPNLNPSASIRASPYEKVADLESYK